LPEADMKISVLIPFYNEESQIPITLSALLPVLESLGCDFEAVLVDDGSSDGTWRALRAAAAEDARIHAIRFSRNFGKEAALCAALDVADGDACIVMDGDLQHPPSVLPEMVRLWREEGFEIVEGVKSSRGRESLGSRLNAALFYRLFKRLSGFDLENASDFKLLDRRVVSEWRRLGEHDTFFRGLSAWLGFQRCKVPFEVAERKAGTSKWSPLKLLRLSLNAITSFSAMPLQFVSFIGGVLIVLSLALGIQTLVLWATGGAASGFTTVILLLLLIGGCIMLSLGLIGLYLARIFDEVKGRPRYIVADDTRRRAR
jgi:dolichol-phosphate mannosyltransferase